jgi:hypothetical protein
MATVVILDHIFACEESVERWGHLIYQLDLTHHERQVRYVCPDRVKQKRCQLFVSVLKLHDASVSYELQKVKINPQGHSCSIVAPEKGMLLLLGVSSHLNDYYSHCRY